MAVVALAFPATAFRSPPQRLRLPGAAGRRPGGQGGDVLLDEVGLVRRRRARHSSSYALSVGRLGEEADLQRDDADLVELALADLADALGVTDPPVDARVTRWGGGLPQYAVGHVGRVERIRAAVAAHPGLAVCGRRVRRRRRPGLHRLRGAARPRELLRQWAP